MQILGLDRRSCDFTEIDHDTTPAPIEGDVVPAGSSRPRPTFAIAPMNGKAFAFALRLRFDRQQTEFVAGDTARNDSRTKQCRVLPRLQRDRMRSRFDAPWDREREKRERHQPAAATRCL